jgi:sugar phosphate isomerase/epimerase
MKNHPNYQKTLSIMLMLFFTLNLSAQYNHIAAESAGWKLAAQAFTFKNFTLEQTLDKLNEAGIKYIEMYSRQEIGAGITGTTNHNMDQATFQKLKNLISSKGIVPINYGVVRASDSAEWVKVFEFAKFMGIETILCEPEIEALPMLDRFANQYKIKVAIHNHPLPTYYWHPSIVLHALAGRSELMGAAPDIGHWVRSGLDPIQCIQQLEGRIVCLHMKDLNESGIRAAHDVPWGTGVCNLAGVLHELNKQGFKGVFSVEYEYNWDNSLPEVKESAQYFYRLTSRLIQ